jgi:hypothetical protein
VGLDVLLLDGHWRQALASARVFGRAGKKIGVVTSDGDSNFRLAAHSRWCNLTAELPDPTDDSDGYALGLAKLLDEHPTDVVSLFMMAQLKPLGHTELQYKADTTPLACEPALDIAVDKKKTLAIAERLGMATPRRIALTCEAEIVSAVREIGLPAVIKPDRSWSSQGKGGIRMASQLVQSLDEAKLGGSKILSYGITATIQEWLPGRRDAVSFFMTQGNVWARFAQTSYREYPPLGGASVFCESIGLLVTLQDPLND